MSEIGLDQSVHLRPDAERETSEESIALSLERTEYLAPRESGAELWLMLASGTTRRQLASALRGSWDLPPEQAQHDADVFVAELEAQGLLEAVR